MHDELIRSSATEMPDVGEFMRHLAHELGNPVAALKMSAELLQGQLRDEDREQLMEVVAEESARLELLVGRAVYYATLTRAAYSEVDFRAVVDRAVAERRSAADGDDDQPHVQIEVDVDTAAPASAVNGDSLQLVRLVREVVDNAVDAAAGTVALRLDRNGSTCRLTVSDDGEGIDPQRLDRIFDPFFTTRDGRLGVGMTIAIAIVALHGGSIRVARRTSAGTTVSIDLPSADSTETNSNS